ncbi:hypothetical protein THAOC_01230 [Thalassiosira oceanica]|uniref:Uncharacterized protein n=1 Tax=Thalassiosira oceanica TaxID=159749 RepID=K0TR08_THAOC|nr:hypothetical protein THAOC_01230 [Thalassiosira oceanica]|eukprot:EJK76972.1 hypothetical protein THAOC_01230 [Thalassiosira oceanica]
MSTRISSSGEVITMYFVAGSGLLPNVGLDSVGNDVGHDEQASELQIYVQMDVGTLTDSGDQIFIDLTKLWQSLLRTIGS